MRGETKLINTSTGIVITLPTHLYPVDDLSWSKVVSREKYANDGTLIVQQSVRKAGKPLTLQTSTNGSVRGAIKRSLVNRLIKASEELGQKFWLDYLADGVVKRVKVAFDHTQQPIKSEPIKGYISPKPDDLFSVVLKFKEVE